MRMSSWKASKPCGTARRSAARATLCQRPNRRGCAVARAAHLRRRPRVRHGPGRPHHARQEARLEGLGEELARYRLGAVPGVAVRRHLRVHERAHARAERLVRRRVVGAARSSSACEARQRATRQRCAAQRRMHARNAPVVAAIPRWVAVRHQVAERVRVRRHSFSGSAERAARLRFAHQLPRQPE
jgi:hypothetical protein